MKNSTISGSIDSLDIFCNELESELGAKFISGVLYGSLAGGEVVDSDKGVINFMIVLNEINTEILDIVGDALRKVKSRKIALLTLSENDLVSSTDVFPIKFLNIKRNHKIYYGKDVMSSLEISKQNLRLRCEQEVKNLMLRLRQSYLSSGQNRNSLSVLIKRAYGSLLRDMSVIVEIKSGEIKSSEIDIINTCSTYGVDVKALLEIQSFKSDGLPNNLDELKRLLESLMKCVRELADYVDKMD